jgi:hypothetical protein
MNKLGILGIVITIAFVTGIITANPGVEGVSGWQAAVIEINDEISDINDFIEDISGFDLQDMLDDIAKNADDIENNAENIEANEEKITDLENEVVSIMNQEENCDDGQVPKRDSFSDTGWSCQDDETGDGGGGTPGDPLDKIKLIPQLTEPSECNESNAGIIYYQNNSNSDASDSVCVCITDSSDFETFLYRDLFSGNECEI